MLHTTNIIMEKIFRKVIEPFRGWSFVFYPTFSMGTVFPRGHIFRLTWPECYHREHTRSFGNHSSPWQPGRAVPSSHVSLVHRIGPGIQGVRMRCLWEACHSPLARRRQMLGIYPTNLLILPSHPPYHWMFFLQLTYLQFPFIVSTRQELLSPMKSQKWCSFLLCPPNFGIVEIYYCW